MSSSEATMRAMRLVNPSSKDQAFSLDTVPRPKPGPGQVLLKTRFSGLNFADVMARQGIYREAPPVPSILGYDVVGTVVEKGPDSGDIAIGTEVVAMTRFGAYAEYALADHRVMAPTPQLDEPAAATALATQYCTAYYAAILLGNLQEGDRVLIHAAAGGVGTALIQLAKTKNCEIFGTAGSQKKLDYLKSQGVHHPINYRSEDFVERVKALSSNGKVEVIFDPIGGRSFRKDKKIIGHGGRILLYGVAQRNGKKGLLPTLKLLWDFGIMNPVAFMLGSYGVLGFNLLHLADNRPEVMKKCLDAIMQLTKEGKLQPQLDVCLPVQEIHEAHQRLESRKSIGKVAVSWENLN